MADNSRIRCGKGEFMCAVRRMPGWRRKRAPPTRMSMRWRPRRRRRVFRGASRALSRSGISKDDPFDFAQGHGERSFRPGESGVVRHTARRTSAGCVELESMTYRFLEDVAIADLAYEVEAQSLPDLLAEAAEALLKVQIENLGS